MVRFAAIVFVVGLIGASILGALHSNNMKQEGDREDGLYMPPAGIVPDSLTAVRIAEAVWLPVYGEDVLDEKPYDARLVNDSLWVVEGSLPKKYMLGGVAYIEIQKKDGKVLGVIHGE